MSLKIENEGMPELFVKYAVDTVEKLSVKMAEGVTLIILNIISIVIILVVIKLVFYYLKKSAKWINDLPVIGIVNRVFGMIISGMSAIMLLFILVAVIVVPPSNTTEFSKNICRGINESYILSRVVDYNFFVNYRSLSNME